MVRRTTPEGVYNATLAITDDKELASKQQLEATMLIQEAMVRKMRINI